MLLFTLFNHFFLAYRLKLCYYYIVKILNKCPAVRVQSRLSFELTLMKWELDFTCGAEAPGLWGPVKHVRRHPPVEGAVQNNGLRHGGVILMKKVFLF